MEETHLSATQQAMCLCSTLTTGNASQLPPAQRNKGNRVKEDSSLSFHKPTESTGTPSPPPVPPSWSGSQESSQTALPPSSTPNPTQESCRCFAFLGCLEAQAQLPLLCWAEVAPAPCQAPGWQHPLSSAAHWVGKLVAFMPRPVIYSRHSLRQLPKLGFGSVGATSPPLPCRVKTILCPLTALQEQNRALVLPWGHGERLTEENKAN